MRYGRYTEHCLQVIAIALWVIVLPSLARAGHEMRPARSLKVRTISPGLATSVPAANEGLKAKTIFLIDVRSPGAFEQYSIPGSLNIAAHAVKTKPFLKAKPVVLVNEGFAILQLAETCEALNRTGFKASILAGGLLAWKAKGGPLNGDPFAMQQLYRVPPQVFIQEANLFHHLIVDAGAKEQPQISVSTIADLYLDLLNDKQGPAQLKQAIKANNSDPFLSVLIIAADDPATDRLQRQLSQAGIRWVFFLQGGRQGYQHHLGARQLAARPREERKVSTAGCKTCADRMNME